MIKDIKLSAVTSIDESLPFEVETHASDYAIAATLNQAGRPVAFFSRMLNKSEANHSAIEKEAYTIAEALHKWRYLLLGRSFKLLTDQKSVSFIFNNHRSGKVKNEKIERWRFELSEFKFDIVYRPGVENAGPDTLSRTCCSLIKSDLMDIHNSLCHPGITRMLHFIRSHNLPYSIADVKKMISSCPVCSELKPAFHKSLGTLIKATQSFERLNLDFKGPLPSATCNKYILTVVDEYSRFPFAIPCKDMTVPTIISCLNQLFSLFGTPSYIHSDIGANFLSKEHKYFLHKYGIATSRTSRYNPQGNGQVERYNGIIWKAVTLCLRGKGMQINAWESVLSESLHSIRSLLCTATNQTPHERLFTYQRRAFMGTSAHVVNESWSCSFEASIQG